MQLSNIIRLILKLFQLLVLTDMLNDADLILNQVIKQLWQSIDCLEEARFIRSCLNGWQQGDIARRLVSPMDGLANPRYLEMPQAVQAQVANGFRFLLVARRSQSQRNPAAASAALQEAVAVASGGRKKVSLMIWDVKEK